MELAHDFRPEFAHNIQTHVRSKLCPEPLRRGHEAALVSRMVQVSERYSGCGAEPLRVVGHVVEIVILAHKRMPDGMAKPLST